LQKEFLTLGSKGIRLQGKSGKIVELEIERMETNSMFNQKSLKNSRGMTLLEIIIVLGILGSLIAILLQKITGGIDKSKLGETKIIMGQVSNALNMYYTDCGKFPETLDGLVHADSACSNWGPEAYMKKAPKDAWGTDMIYTVEGNNFVLKSLGADRREGGEGFAKDISSEEQ
jgi:general secretion pathway protein G